jgi:hypothetical protein
MRTNPTKPTHTKIRYGQKGTLWSLKLHNFGAQKKKENEGKKKKKGACKLVVK